MPKLVYNEAKPTIISIEIANLVGDYEQTYEWRWRKTGKTKDLDYFQPWMNL